MMKLFSKDVAQAAESCTQDEWTVVFCEKFRKLREANIIPTNKSFADEIGLNPTALSHVLAGRNFPKKQRSRTESALVSYERTREYLQSQKTSDATSGKVTTEELSSEHIQLIPPSIKLTEKRNKLHEEILHLNEERQKLKQEIAILQDKLISLQTIVIQRLEKLSCEGSSIVEAGDAANL